MAQDLNLKDIKVGDYAKCYDQSYALKLMRDSKYAHPTWLRTHEDTLLGQKELKVIEIDLKVPVMDNNMKTVDLDSDDNPIYLDTMIRDGHGSRWLVQGRFLDIQSTVL